MVNDVSMFLHLFSAHIRAVISFIWLFAVVTNPPTSGQRGIVVKRVIHRLLVFPALLILVALELDMDQILKQRNMLSYPLVD